MKPVTVLLVDDEASFLEVMTDYLALTDEFSLECALSAQEALEKCQDTRYDAIVSDFSMPDMNGIEFLKEIRTVSNVPFILFTGVGDENVINEAIENDVDNYLEKGGDPDVLFPKLCQMIYYGIIKKQIPDNNTK